MNVRQKLKQTEAKLKSTEEIKTNEKYNFMIYAVTCRSSSTGKSSTELALLRPDVTILQ